MLCERGWSQCWPVSISERFQAGPGELDYTIVVRYFIGINNHRTLNPIFHESLQRLHR